MGRFLDWLFPDRASVRKAAADAEFDAAWEQIKAERREIDDRIAKAGVDGFYAFVRSRGFTAGEGQPHWVWTALLSEYEATMPRAPTHQPDRHVH